MISIYAVYSMVVKITRQIGSQVIHANENAVSLAINKEDAVIDNAIFTTYDRVAMYLTVFITANSVILAPHFINLFLNPNDVSEYLSFRTSILFGFCTFLSW